MSSTGTRQIIWANGEDTFCIAKVGQLLELEDKCKAGIGEILQRLATGSWKLNDIRETIRLGLVGGGMDAVEAMIVVKRHVDEHPLGPNVILAYEVLSAAIVGVEGEEVTKKAEAEKENQTSSETMAVSAEGQSSNSEPGWDASLPKSMNSPSGNSPQP